MFNRFLLHIFRMWGDLVKGPGPHTQLYLPDQGKLKRLLKDASRFVHLFVDIIEKYPLLVYLTALVTERKLRLEGLYILENFEERGQCMHA